MNPDGESFGFDFVVEREPDVDFEVGRYALRSFRLVTRSGTYMGWPRYGDAAAEAALRANPNISYGELCRISARGRMQNVIAVSDGIRISDGTIAESQWISPSHGSGADWLDGTCIAVCRRLSNEPHDAPHEGCKCGIYGSLSYADLLSQFRDYAKHIVAVIAVAGTTFIGDRGLRTQYAKVVAYWTDDDPLRRATAATQFADATVFDTPVAMVEAYGLALLPPPKDRRYDGPEWWTDRTLER